MSATSRVPRSVRNAQPCLCSRFSVRPSKTTALVGGSTELLTTKCSGVTAGGNFLPGHDAKLKALLVVAYFEGSEALLRDGETFAGGALEAARQVSDRFVMAVAGAIDKESVRLRRRLEVYTSGMVTESPATKAVFLALQKSLPGGGHEPVGSSFGADRDDYEAAARAWLRDQSELSERSIERADWDAVYAWFIKGESA